jgi:membrane associated rhomboid family serine protease
MNWGLIAANILMFGAQQVFKSIGESWHLSPSQPRIWNFLTYAFLHANSLHLLGNMLFLYIFGNNVNDKLGHMGYLAFYLAGAVFAGVGYTVAEMQGGTMYPVVGASGAVSAVTGAYLVLFPRSHITVIYMIFFIGSIEIPSMWFIGLFFVQDLILNAAGQTGVAHVAHLAGTAFGFAICFGLLAANLLPRDQFDIVALVQRWNRRRQYRDMVSRGYDPFNYRPEKLPGPPDPQQEKIQELRGKIGDAITAHDHTKAAEHYQELRKIDPQHVLARQAQLDVANQLASQQLYSDAAEAYELFLANYKNFEQIEQVELMLGLIYARYLERYDKAKEYLLRALARLHGDRQVQLAKTELARIEPLVAGTG